MRGLVFSLLLTAVAIAMGCRSSSRSARPAAATGATSITSAPRGSAGGWTTDPGTPAVPRATVPVAQPPLAPQPPVSGPVRPTWSEPPLEPLPVAGDAPADGSGASCGAGKG